MGAIVSSLLKTISGGNCFGGTIEVSKYENKRFTPVSSRKKNERESMRLRGIKEVVTFHDFKITTSF